MNACFQHVPDCVTPPVHHATNRGYASRDRAECNPLRPLRPKRSITRRSFCPFRLYRIRLRTPRTARRFLSQIPFFDLSFRNKSRPTRRRAPFCTPAYHQQQSVIPQRRERRLGLVYPGEAICSKTMEPAKFHSDPTTASEKFHHRKHS